jgi:hypothetical protein
MTDPALAVDRGIREVVKTEDWNWRLEEMSGSEETMNMRNAPPVGGASLY